MSKLNLAIICGGRSAEHEVSLISAKNVIAAVDLAKYNLSVLAVDKAGEFRFYQDSQNFLDNQNDPDKIALKNDGFSKVAWNSVQGKAQAILLDSSKEIKIDVIFPVMHGSFAEDGKMQGFLEMLGSAYVGPDVLASAISMDKEITKKLAQMSDISIAKYLTFDQDSRAQINFSEVKNALSMPVFVKPANAGSSVGVSKASDEQTFKQAVEEAFKFDYKILIEEAVEGREIECSVLGNREKLIAGEVGEIIPSKEHGFYSYDAKYIDENGAALIAPAKLDPNKKQEVQELAKKVFKTCQCEGMARVDFFMTGSGAVVFNEINTIPGFTNISMYPKLMMLETGLSYGELIDQLIDLALKRQQRNSQILFDKK